MAKVRVLTGVFSEASGWALSREHADAIRRVDESVTVTVASSKEEFDEALPDADVLFGGSLGPEQLARAENLRWIQLTSAGANTVLTPELIKSDVTLTTASGVHPVQISEHVFAMMLIFARRMHEYLRAQLDGRWDRGPVSRIDELYEKTLGIVGLGNIGRACARKAKVFGMRVVGTKRATEKAAVPDVDELIEPDDIDPLLKQSDYVVLAIPLTAETAGLIGRDQLAAMKSSAVLINVARGAVVDEEALIDALNREQIAGAGLDTFATEPLPPESPLWRMPNVIITPHTAGATPRYWERATRLFCENLRRFIDGKPLKNVVDRELGY